MQSSLRQSRRIALALSTALALGGVAAAAKSDDPTRCRIGVAREGRTIMLTMLAEADEATSGSYALRVSGGGRGGGTNLRQGGAFRAGPGRPATLGTITLNASGASYDVDLELVVDGETIACSKRIGGGN